MYKKYMVIYNTWNTTARMEITKWFEHDKPTINDFSDIEKAIKKEIGDTNIIVTNLIELHCE